MNYVYRMLDKDGKVLYVGKTIHMYDRMCLHFGNHTLPMKQIPEDEAGRVERVEYTEIANDVDAALLEVYLIAKLRPEFNRDWVYTDTPTFVLEYGELDWKEWELRIHDNPHHHIFVWKDGELLYEIPKIHSVYDALCKELGIEQDMNFGYSVPVYANGYKLMRLSEKRYIKTGSGRQTAKYSFMGYPEEWYGKYENENKNDTVGE